MASIPRRPAALPPPPLDRDEQPRVVRPLATATISPTGLRSDRGQEHALTLVLELVDGKRADVTLARTMSIAQRAMTRFAPEDGQPDRRTFHELSSSRRRPGTVDVVVVGVEASVVWPERPSEVHIAHLAEVLAAEGYRRVLRERRACAQASCTTEAMVDWNARGNVPSTWFDARICGRHNYRQCQRCASVYLLVGYAAAGQAEAVHCEVCGNILVEWGSSKRWDAELVTRSEWVG
jgi:hypothetical protein